MSTLKTNNIEHLDASTPSIQTTIGGGTILAGVSTVSDTLKVGTGITFNTDGSAEFAGAIDASGLITADGGGTFGVIDASSTAAIRCYGGGYSTLYSFNVNAGVKGVFVGADQNGAFTSTINNDGSSWFAGGVKVGGSLPNNSTIQLNADGSAAFDGTITLSTAGTGIDFSATSDGSGTSTSELFDDYEEGTWIPNYTSTATNPVLVYNSVTAGYYTKTGRVVNVSGRITVDSVTSPGSGSLQISNLPFTIANSQTARATTMALYSSSWTSAAPCFGLGTQNTGQIRLYYWPAMPFTSPTSISTANLNATCTLYFAFTYIV